MTQPSEQPVQVESVVVRLRRHGRRLTLPVLLLIALAAASGFWVGALPETWMNWTAGLGAAAIALLLGVGPILSWLTDRAIITDRRVLLRHGVFVQRRTEVALSRVREVRTRRGPVQRIFGSGNVELLVGPESPVVLRDVPSPNLIADALQELLERNFIRGATPFGGPGAAPFGPGAVPLGGPDSASPGASGATSVLPS